MPSGFAELAQFTPATVNVVIDPVVGSNPIV